MLAQMYKRHPNYEPMPRDATVQIPLKMLSGRKRPGQWELFLSSLITVNPRFRVSLRKSKREFLFHQPATVYAFPRNSPRRRPRNRSMLELELACERNHFDPSNCERLCWLDGGPSAWHTLNSVVLVDVRSPECSRVDDIDRLQMDIPRMGSNSCL